MICPNTPKSVIAELLKKDNSPLRNKSWNTFFSIYYDIIRLMTIKSMAKVGWTSFSEEDISDILSQTFLSLENSFTNGKYKPSDGRHFRGFLKRIVCCRVIDLIRSKNQKRVISFAPIENDDMFSQKPFDDIEEDEEKTFMRARIMDIWESIRHAYSPESALIFEMRVFDALSIPEICERLDIDRTKIDKTIHRIKKKIKEELEQNDLK